MRVIFITVRVCDIQNNGYPMILIDINPTIYQLQTRTTLSNSYLGQASLGLGKLLIFTPWGLAFRELDFKR